MANFFEGLLGKIGQMSGGAAKTPDNSLNPLNQPALNVSSMANQNNSNQTAQNEENQRKFTMAPISYTYHPEGDTDAPEGYGYTVENLIPGPKVMSMYDPNIQPDSLVNEINTQNNMFDDLPDGNGLTPNMQMTKGFEDTVGNVYTDTGGIPHYGIGHKMTSDEFEDFGLPEDVSYEAGQKWGDLPVDAQRVDETFRDDYSKAQNSAQNMLGLGDMDYQNMPENIRGIVTDMVFNMGASGVANKFPGFLDAVRSGNYKEAAAQLRYANPTQQDGEWVAGDRGESQYYGQTGQRARTHYDTLSNY